MSTVDSPLYIAPPFAHAQMCAAHLIMSTPPSSPPSTQPHCPTCRTVLEDVEQLAVLQGLGEHMEDLLDLVEQIAERLGLLPPEGES